MHDPSAIMHPALTELAIETAEKEKIPHQLAMRRGGGTDAGRIHLAGEGVPCVVLGGCLAGPRMRACWESLPTAW